MKIYTSYFYKIRFMKPWMIPISTAIWDPKWFHEFKDQNHKFIDKNGVVNGLNYRLLNPGPQGEDGCHGRDGCKFDHNNCKFKLEYRKKIFSLDKEEVLADLKIISNRIQYMLGFKEDPIIMLIVHEDPTNPCSERSVLQDYFNCSEWIENSKKENNNE